jgi:acetyl-CoA C-acetyltransferase
MDAFIYDHVRTPRGKGRKDGGLHETRPVELAAQTLRAIRDRNHIDTKRIDDIYYGVVTPVGEQGGCLPRAAAIEAGYDESVPGVQMNRFCASGLVAVNTAASKVMAGMADLLIGGGVESMSRVPMGADGGAWVMDPEVTYRSYFVPQGVAADLIATIYGYSRKDVDAYAVDSQKWAARAWEKGYFSRSVIPVTDQLGEVALDHDEHIRPDTSMEGLAALTPSFEAVGQNFGFDSVAIQKYPVVERIDHVHHAGNSSGIVDGAAAMLVGSKEAGEMLGLKPRARIRSFCDIATDPTIMLTGPSYAAEQALKRAGMKKGDIDLWELNEAFASVVLLFMDRLNIARDNINVNGGAIAMGHPFGATGTMILGTLLDEMERRDLSTGLCALCIGGGMGTATIIERV